MRENIVLVLEIVTIMPPSAACSKIQHEKPRAKGDLTHVILEWFSSCNSSFLHSELGEMNILTKLEECAFDTHRVRHICLSISRAKQKPFSWSLCFPCFANMVKMLYGILHGKLVF